MDIILKKNGKLIYKAIKKGQKDKDITDSATRFLMCFIEVEKGVTLRQFLSLFNDKKSINTINEFLTFCWFRDLMKEAFRKNGKTNKEYKSINVGKSHIEICKKEFSFKSCFPRDREKLIKVKPYAEGGNWYNCDGTGKDNVVYSIWPTSISHYMDIPLVINDKIDIVEMCGHKSKIVNKVKSEMRMLEILYSVCYEMTFDGIVTLEDEKKFQNKEKTDHDILNRLNEVGDKWRDKK